MIARGRKLRLSVLSVVLAMGLGGLGAFALADDGDDDDCEGDEDEEDCGGGSPGEVHEAVSYRHPCWITSANGPSGRRELIVGRMFGWLEKDGTGTKHAESYFNSVGTDCATDDLVTGSGTITASFFIRLSSWYIQDSSTTTGTTFNMTFEADWHASDDCSGAATTLGTTKSWTEVTTASELNWEEADRFDTATTADGRGFVVTPAAGVTRSVFFTLTTTVLGASSSETGCFAYKG